MPTPVTVLTADAVVTVAATIAGQRVVLARETLETGIGWHLEPSGLCRGDVCVAVRDVDSLMVGDELDLVAVAAVLDLPVVVDAETATVALGSPRSQRRHALVGRTAPPFVLPDLDGNLHALEEWRDRRKLLVAFASW